MLTNIDILQWTPSDVKNWLQGLCDDSAWLNVDYISNNNVNGKELLLMTARDLCGMGATKVDLQEHILDCIERLKFYNFEVAKETLQFSILKLACQSRSLQRQLVAENEQDLQINRESQQFKSIILSKDVSNNLMGTKQRVSLDTLALVSTIVKTVSQITEILNSTPFSKQDDYRTMKSLLLALSIELTSTAQRDQFVERPNDIIGKSSKALADYCDRIVLGTKDILLIQPFQLERVRIRRGPNETDLGLIVKSQASSHRHMIDKIIPLSPAKKTNKLNVGDEIIQINELIVGWSEKNVMKLLEDSSRMEYVTLMVKKYPNET